ncbi:ECF transporter S component [Bacillus sp. FSL W7-1360]
MKKKQLTLTDIIVTIMIAVVFAIVYRLWTPLYDIVSVTGLQLHQLIYGMWFIAGPLAMLIIRKPGIAILAQTAASVGSFLAGSPYGPLSLLLYGFFQGLGAELAFAMFRYRLYHMGVAILGAIGASIASFSVDYFNDYLLDYTTWNLSIRVILRTISAILIAGVFATALVRALEKTGVVQLIRPVSQADYARLEAKRKQ